MTPWDRRTVRVFALGFSSGAAAALLVVFLPLQLVDRFYQRQIEQKAVAVWERQAVGMGYDECRSDPAACVGRIVEWPVNRNGDGASFWGGTPADVIRWRNPGQVPRVPGRGGVFTAVARVVSVEADAVVLLYIGTPQPVYGGTTWKDNFGAKKNGEGFTF